MSKLIKFIPSTKNDEDLKYVDVPKPSINFLPDWWKKQSLTIDKDSTSKFDNFSFKACMPFLDSLIFGYMIYTSQDIAVSLLDGKPSVEWQTVPEPLLYRSAYQGLPVPAGHYEDHFAWKFPFGFQLPKGYSILITHPFNRFDLPFTTVSGIVDDGVPWGGKVTFWLKEGFDGIIPKNTPIAQILPFKTENWKSERDDSLIQHSKDMLHKRQTIQSGFYKKFIHRKKKFE
jgi:hypothetical protein